MATHTPLKGVRVIDFTVAGAGPAAGKMLADWGADVIKVEPLTGEAGRVTGLTLGMRADESLQRYSGLLNKRYGYKNQCWISQQFKDVWCASPLYDWSAEDVWHANCLFGYDYNRLYDLYYMAGLKVSQMRVA